VSDSWKSLSDLKASWWMRGLCLMIEGYAVGEGGVTQTLARSGFTRTGPFHDLRQRPIRAAGPSHYGAKAENEHTA
jgi:hypothetical protein